jgi:hypothetical protein
MKRVSRRVRFLIAGVGMLTAGFGIGLALPSQSAAAGCAHEECDAFGACRSSGTHTVNCVNGINGCITESCDQ